MNKVILMGNLTRDPDLRYTTGGTAICALGLAVNRRYTSRSGEQAEEVCFVDIDVFGKQAESCKNYLQKGAPALIEGRLKFDTWDDRATGEKRSKLHVVAERVQFIGAPSRGAGFGDSPPQQSFQQAPPQQQGGYPQAPQQQQGPGFQPQRPAAAPMPAFDTSGLDAGDLAVEDDDAPDQIPF
ncbi:MAG: single-stranded DNA-binding protein [Lentisphaeria bacterium]|nr:single-stranded DNA-binding protein [Lentisphaeria bacterium]